MRESKIEQFNRLVKEGVEAWTKAGELLNQLLAEDPNARRKIMESNPHMTIPILEGFQRIGNKEIYPYLLMDRSVGAQRLIQLPYSAQKSLYGHVVEVAEKKHGEIIVSTKKIVDLTRAEAELVFSETDLRSIPEQRKMLRPQPVIRQSIRNKSDSSPNSFFSFGRTRAAVTGDPLEDEPPESLDDPPDETIDQHLSAAQGHLLRVRHLITVGKFNEGLDAHIARALKEVGELRFSLKEKPLKQESETE